MIVYQIIATGLQKRATSWEAVHKHSGSRVLDGVTFTSSLMLMCGLIDKAVMKTIGDIKPFLFFAASYGVMYAILALVPKKE